MAKKNSTKLSRSEAIGLMKSTQRGSDDFMNATEWCKRYGTNFGQFQRLPEAQKYIAAVCKKLDVQKKHVIQVKRGKGSETFTHPLIFLELIRWLDTDVAVFANEVFQKYLEGDADLGLDIMLRDHNKERFDRAKHRLEVVQANKQTATLAQMHGTPVPQVHNDRYRGLYRKSASQLRGDVEQAGIELRKDETPLNVMSAYDLSLNTLANMMALQCEDPNAVFSVSDGLRDLHERKVGKPLNPKWEDKRMTPSGARSVLKGQLELPIN